MSKKCSTSSKPSQRDSAARSRFKERMGAVGFVVGTQIAYLRAMDRFERALEPKSLEQATVKEARHHLSELKQQGVSSSSLSHASAALRFFFEEVLGTSWKPMSALRLRMIEDMELAGFAPKTQNSYLRAVEALARYYNRAPDGLSEEDIRTYFVYLTCERKLARPTVTIALCGIKFFYEKTLKRDWTLTGVPTPKRQKKMPVVLSRQQVMAILSRVREVRHRACLSLIYACGLRIGEACRIQLTDIDRVRGLLHVRGGKGAKDRYVPLPEPILPLLEACWRSHRNRCWLFPWVGRGGRNGQITDRHVPLSSVQQAFRRAYAKSGVTKAVSVHSLRHAYATHLREAHVDLRQIQVWLGHNSPSVTAVYAHLTDRSTQVSAQVVHELMADVAKMA